MSMMTQGEENANCTVNRFRGNAHEFYMLKGVLCVDHGYSPHQAMRVGEVCDLQVIAQRMDAIWEGRGDMMGPLYYRQQKN